MRRLKRLLVLGVISALLSTVFAAVDGAVTKADALFLLATAVSNEDGKLMGWHCRGACIRRTALCCDIGPAYVE